MSAANAQGWTFGSKNNEARLTGDTMRVGGWEVKREGTAINLCLYTSNKDFYFKSTIYLLHLTRVYYDTAIECEENCRIKILSG